MELSLYQIIVPSLSLLTILYVWHLCLQRRKSIWSTFLWTVFWVAIAAAALFPGFLDILSSVTGIKDNVNAIFITSIGILFWLVFMMIIRFEHMQQRHVQLVRSLALLKFSKDQKNTQNSN